MKKIIALFLATIMLMSLVGCDYFKTNDDTTPPEQVKIRIGYMAGPTGMGMAKLIHDNGGLENGNDKYSFTKYADTNAAKADLAAGKIDIICLPTNEAAVYSNTIDKTAKVLAINCLNSLYLVSNVTSTFRSEPSEITLSDFDGKTIYTCKNGTPRIVIEYLVKTLNLNITISYEVDGKEILTPNDLAAQVIAGNIPNAVMPEPIVTNVVLKTAANSHTDRIYVPVINLTDEWSKALDTPLTMGCIIADGDFATYNTEAVNEFLEEYKASIDYIGDSDNIDSAADYVAETDVMGAVPAAKMALNNLGSSITYIDGEEMKNALVNFYNALGIALPDDSFYYEK